MSICFYNKKACIWIVTTVQGDNMLFIYNDSGGSGGSKRNIFFSQNNISLWTLLMNQPAFLKNSIPKNSLSGFFTMEILNFWGQTNFCKGMTYIKQFIRVPGGPLLDCPWDDSSVFMRADDIIPPN